MARFAHTGRIDMGNRLTLSINSVVALHTIHRDSRVIEQSALEARGVMAGVAWGNSWNVVGCYPPRRYTVVATCTGSKNLRMIHHECRPRTWPVAKFAGTGASDMIGEFSACVGTIMALRAISSYPGVVKYRSRETYGVMTNIALRRSWNMVDTFAQSDRTIVTTRAGSNDLRMIDRRYRHPSHGDMAPLTQVSRLDMTRTLASRADAIVALYAISTDTRVIELSADP